LRGVSFDAARYNSFIDLQDKLHQNICRKRSLVAIGTHDLDAVQGPFTYEAQPPEDIRFVPLKQEREFSGSELMEFYKGDQKLKAFLPILEGSLVFPVLYDAHRTVMSMPPIINGARSAISLATRNVFIECTAIDLTKANIVLNMVVTMFSQYAAAPFSVECVEVVDALGVTTVHPDLASRPLTVDMEYVNRCTGARSLLCSCARR
jgi:phenylalanyl-tRNA synthetase beta chain